MAWQLDRDFNPVMDGIQAFGLVRNIQNADQNQKNLQEDRETRRLELERQHGIQDDQIARQQVIQGQQDADRIRTQSREDEADALAKEKRQNENALKVMQILSNSDNLTPAQLDKVQPFLPDYAKTALTLQGADTALKNYNTFKTAIKTKDYDAALEAVNNDPGFSAQLKARAQAQGNKNMKLVDVRPGTTQGTVQLGVMVEKQNGEIYGPVPLTMKAGTEAQGDNIVKQYPVEKILEAFAGQAQLAGMVKKAYQSFGDKKKGNFTAVGGPKTGYKLLNKDDGTVGDTIIPAAEGLGSENPVDKSFKAQTDVLVGLSKKKADIESGASPWGGEIDDANVQRQLATINKAIEDQERYIQAKFPDQWKLYIGDGESARPVPPQQRIAMMDKAKKLATEWADGKETLWNLDSTDFKEYGGTKADAIAQKTQEIYALLMGENPATSGIGKPIDTTRPIIHNPDGTFSTEKTITVGFDDGFYNIPTIVNGKQVSKEEAIRLFKAGKNKDVGKFKTEAEALAAARKRTKEIGKVRSPKKKTKGKRPSLDEIF